MQSALVGGTVDVHTLRKQGAHRVAHNAPSHRRGAHLQVLTKSLKVIAVRSAEVDLSNVLCLL